MVSIRLTSRDFEALHSKESRTYNDGKNAKLITPKFKIQLDRESHKNAQNQMSFSVAERYIRALHVRWNHILMML